MGGIVEEDGGSEDGSGCCGYDCESSAAFLAVVPMTGGWDSMTVAENYVENFKLN
ncbi:hypothetical protein A2U01_0053972, partial [Trifolium medium]|nr:hypothetical protein [Trifolium medium]